MFKAKDPFDVPGPPGQPEVSEITKDMATIIWTAPKNDGGAQIDNYVVEMRRTSDVKWQIVNKSEKITDLTFNILNLKEETEYEFRVSAENKAGRGPPSAPCKPAKYGEDFYI